MVLWNGTKDLRVGMHVRKALFRAAGVRPSDFDYESRSSRGVQWSAFDSILCRTAGRIPGEVRFPALRMFKEDSMTGDVRDTMWT